MNKRLHFPIGISKNYIGITHSFIAAKVYNALFLSRIRS